MMGMIIVELIQNINEKNKSKMKQTLNNDIKFMWDDTELEDIILFKIKNISCHYEESDAVQAITREINRQIYMYNIGKIDKNLFLNKIELELNKLESEECKYYFRYNYSYFEELVKKQTQLILHGPGGIGKSHFIYYLSEKLVSTEIKYLTIYGKWIVKDDLKALKEIEEVCRTNRFVLFIDAINEVSNELRVELINEIRKLKEIDNLSIIITYRDNSFDSSCLDVLSFYEELFTGVNYQSAVEELIQFTGESIFEYEDILQTNNPLYLKILYEVLLKKDFKKDKKSITSITHILEQYIKNKKCCGDEAWWFVKDIAQKMFEKGEKYLTETEILAIKPQNALILVEQLISFNLLSFYDFAGEKNYFFVMETYTDYLIARSMFDFLKKNFSEESISVVKSKIDKMFSLRELFILVIVDYSSTIEEALIIIKKCNLELNSSIISKMNFKGKDVQTFQKSFICSQSFSLDMFEYLAGLYNKPFNCTNYINEIFLNNKDIFISFAKRYGTNIQRFSFNTINLKLKNMLYRIDMNYINCPEYEEYFWYSIWCAGLSNCETQVLSVKMLIMLSDLNSIFLEKIISYYDRFDELIKENMILVLCNVSMKNRQKIIPFVTSLLKDNEYTHADNLARISKFLFSDYTQFIKYNKINILDEVKDYSPSKNLVDYIYKVCIHDKTFFRFDEDCDYFYLSNQFLNYEKDKVEELNFLLANRFKCLKYGECYGSFHIPDCIKEEVECDFSELIDNKLIIDSIFYMIEKFLEKYSIDLSERFDYENFSNTFIARIFLLAENIAFGSVISNYYENDLISYNDGTDFVGYKPHNPIQYDFEKFNFNALLPAFNNLSDYLDRKVVSKVNNGDRNKIWAMDMELSKKNILKLLEPIIKKDYQWKPIVLYFSLSNFSIDSVKWDEHYNFYINLSDKDHIIGDSSDRYLSIECPSYEGNLYDYQEMSKEKYRCCSLYTLASRLKYLKENTVILPPAKLVKDLSLEFRTDINAWVNSSGEIIIIGNKDKEVYDKTKLLYSLYIREDVFNEYKKSHYVNYIGFTEKYYEPIGRPRETAFDFEILNDDFSKIYMHYENNKTYEPMRCAECDTCTIFSKQENDDSDQFDYDELLKKLGYLFDD